MVTITIATTITTVITTITTTINQTTRNHKEQLNRLVVLGASYSTSSVMFTLQQLLRHHQTVYLYQTLAQHLVTYTLQVNVHIMYLTE